MAAIFSQLCPPLWWYMVACHSFCFAGHHMHLLITSFERLPMLVKTCNSWLKIKCCSFYKCKAKYCHGTTQHKLINIIAMLSTFLKKRMKPVFIGLVRGNTACLDKIGVVVDSSRSLPPPHPCHRGNMLIHIPCDFTTDTSILVK